MYEKVNPKHPDKIADRIAGALVDLAYRQGDFPHIAVEVLIGHGKCHIINETDTPLEDVDVLAAVKRITKSETIDVDYVEVQQDALLNANQHERVRCGDNGIFRGCPPTEEQRVLTAIAATIYGSIPYDGKYIIGQGADHMTHLTICQSHATKEEIDRIMYECCDKFVYFDTHSGYPIDEWRVNPLGPWTGGIDVDCGCTNRKLGSDMGDAVTGGGLHGKDLSKADVSVNLYLHKLAQEDGRTHTARCTIGDIVVIVDGEGVPFSRIVNEAREYINDNYDGMFENLADWGLIDPYVI